LVENLPRGKEGQARAKSELRRKKKAERGGCNFCLGGKAGNYSIQGGSSKPPGEILLVNERRESAQNWCLLP